MKRASHRANQFLTEGVHQYEYWRARLQDAATTDQIRSLMLDYVQTIPPTVIAALPHDCQRALGDSDIPGASVALLKCDLAFKGGNATWEVLHEAALTFSAASMKLNQLARG